jgi:hypothetical protein
MRGINATRKLKFDHPGLATTATRAAKRLTIQNDIGETDAQVVVIAVNPDDVTVTYSDVHRARANLFIRLFDDFPAQWSGLEQKTATALGDEGSFYGNFPDASGHRGLPLNATRFDLDQSAMVLLGRN